VDQRRKSRWHCRTANADSRSVPLLILDDFGLRPLSEVNQSDLYEIISARYEKRSTILTSNRDFSEWPMVFTNPLMGVV
jgi:DNA replication protein DnaC